MDSRRVSAAVGFILLMGCIVGVVVVIYRGGSARSSYKSTVEESWKKRETRKGINDLGPSSFEPPAQEAKLLAEELRRLFVKNTSPGGHLGDGSRDSGDGKGKVGMGPKNGKSSNGKSLSPSKIPSVEMNLPPLPNHPSSPELERGPPPSSSYDDKTREVPGGALQTPAKIISHEESRGTVRRERIERKELEEKAWIPSISPRLQQIPQSHIPGLNSNRKEVLVPSLPSTLYPGPATASKHPSLSMSTLMYSGPDSNPPDKIKGQRQENFPKLPPPNHKFEEWDDDALLNDEDELFDDYDQQYFLGEDDDSSLETRDPLKEMGHLFEAALGLYKSGMNSSNFNGIIKVINETVQRGNNSGLLTQLNELYSRPIGFDAPFLPTADSTNSLGRNAYETSLSAFVFMSFGIFLLNQIHNFVGPEGGLKGQGRSLDTNTLEEASALDVLFQPPSPQSHGNESWSQGDSLTKFGTAQQSKTKNGNESRLNEDLTWESNPGENPDDPGYFNNMFRAVLNLVNAYTKDTQALECIWSLYCQDLDKTAAQQSSLYSMAARINSIGLRLIMGQIPTELTPDVMLRSLLAWDGLPCTKYFPQCKVDDGTVSLQKKEAISGNRTSLQMT